MSRPNAAVRVGGGPTLRSSFGATLAARAPARGEDLRGTLGRAVSGVPIVPIGRAWSNAARRSGCSNGSDSPDSSCLASRGLGAPAFWENEAVWQKHNDCSTMGRVSSIPAFHFSNVKRDVGLLDCPLDGRLLTRCHRTSYKARVPEKWMPVFRKGHAPGNHKPRTSRARYGRGQPSPDHQEEP